jgi:hypothetical protein
MCFNRSLTNSDIISKYNSIKFQHHFPRPKVPKKPPFCLLGHVDLFPGSGIEKLNRQKRKRGALVVDSNQKHYHVLLCQRTADMRASDATPPSTPPLFMAVL